MQEEKNEETNPEETSSRGSLPKENHPGENTSREGSSVIGSVKDKKTGVEKGNGVQAGSETKSDSTGETDKVQASVRPAAGDAKTKAEPAKKPDPRSKLYKPEGRLLLISSSPHLLTTASVSKIMWTVTAALLPATVAAVILFGQPALIMIAACILTAVASEMAMNKLKGESVTIGDGSVVITGLLLALTLPPSFSVWLGMLGVFFAVVFGKHIFGGLGSNIFNPALLGRAFLQASFPVAMTTWRWPQTGKYETLDAVTAATPLGQFKFEKITTNLGDLLIGNIGGSLGETSAIAIIAGGLLLLILKYADWRIPVSFLTSVFIFGGVFHIISPVEYPSPVFHLLSGGLLLGAFFMATDMVTSPVTSLGSWVFGMGAGIILVIIRLFGGLPEGVMYSILLMNAATPLINRYTRPKIFGEVRA
jgi:electron transport complex protein RnfD